MPAHPLPAALDTNAAGPLRTMLLTRIERGEALHLDGGDVVRIGQACLQVLASARATAITRGIGFRLDTRSDALARMVTLARLDAALDPVPGAGA